MSAFVDASPKTIWEKEIFLGRRNDDSALIYLSPPSWDCGWYWGFGYLGNKDEHYHLSSYQKNPCTGQWRNINMYDALIKDYCLAPSISSNLWEFCELALTIYSLRNAAEVLGRGGSHMTKNPCCDAIVNRDEVTRLNNVVIPQLLDTMYSLIGEE